MSKRRQNPRREAIGACSDVTSPGFIRAITDNLNDIRFQCDMILSCFASLAQLTEVVDTL